MKDSDKDRKIPWIGGLETNSGLRVTTCTSKLVELLIGVALLSIVLISNGAIPGYMSPTTALLFWTTGFSQSFANNGLTIFASNFGLPEPASIAFGLAGAFPIAVLVKIGVHPIEAYTTVFATWLIVAFVGAYSLVRHLNGDRAVSLICATIWGTMPVVWIHNHYSMVALGMALLPFYVNAVIRLVRCEVITLPSYVLFFAACLIAVFMDGYTYVMFAVATAIISLVTLIERRTDWVMLVLTRFSAVAIGFISSYWLYISYLGKDEFDVEPLDFFRGWGASIEFLMVATKGFLLVPDLIGLSTVRTPDQYFGDQSTFISTFAMPVAFAGMVCLIVRAGKTSDRTIFALLAVFGFYMCLGPSFKFLVDRPEGFSQLMPAEFSLGPTGTGWISENVPGFKNMRASYRWIALGIFGAWSLLAILASQRQLRQTANLCLAIVALFNVPTISSLHSYVQFRRTAFAIDSDVERMRPYFKAGETVAMLPYRNDFLANYIAARLDIKTYNVGGDKNLVDARKNWPRTMRRFKLGVIDERYPRNITALLENEDADAVVLPYFDLFEAANRWPYPLSFETQLRDVAATVGGNARIAAIFGKQFAILRLKEGLKGLGDTAFATLKVNQSKSPIAAGATDPNVFDDEGWYPLESTGVWSKGKSNLIVNLNAVLGTSGQLQLQFTPYAPRPDVKMTVRVSVHGKTVLEREFIGPTLEVTESIPISSSMIDERGNVQLTFDIAPLHSPLEYGSPDARHLGIMLHSVSIR